jgi:DMSO/TMAO reductase YedYZ molybdopterin-dependent catalytic subunit
MKFKRQGTIRGLTFGAVITAGLVAGFGFSSHRQNQATEKWLLITGDIPAPYHLQTSDLETMPQESATVEEQDGTISKYTGVLLRDVLAKAGVPMGKTLRGKALASYVLAKARDGYEVIFTLGELDAGFGNERVLLAYKVDGKPLFAYQGPFRILCPNDKAGARSLRMLDSLELVRLRK